MDLCKVYGSINLFVHMKTNSTLYDNIHNTKNKSTQKDEDKSIKNLKMKTMANMNNTTLGENLCNYLKFTI